MFEIYKRWQCGMESQASAGLAGSTMDSEFMRGKRVKIKEKKSYRRGNGVEHFR